MIFTKEKRSSEFKITKKYKNTSMYLRPGITCSTYHGTGYNTGIEANTKPLENSYLWVSWISVTVRCFFNWRKYFSSISVLAVCFLSSFSHPRPRWNWSKFMIKFKWKRVNIHIKDIAIKVNTGTTYVWSSCYRYFQKVIIRITWSCSNLSLSFSPSPCGQWMAPHAWWQWLWWFLNFWWTLWRWWWQW